MKQILQEISSDNYKGAIINICSIAAFGPQPYSTLYSASKSFIDFLTRGLAYEYSDYGITIQCIYPGPVNTDILKKVDTDGKLTSGNHPLVPMPDDFASNALETLGFSFATTGTVRFTSINPRLFGESIFLIFSRST